jgi:REP element-mobilizing transposase RayT
MFELPRRGRPAHQPVVEARGRSTVVFLTVCTDKRRPLLACSQVRDLLLAAWRKADRWRVGRYVVMPDHVHLFCGPGTIPPAPLRQWVGYWKSLVAREWHRPEEGRIWQESFWDTQLRTGESYSEKWQYVRNNPVRAGLVKNADDWPFQGEVETLLWLG